MDRPTSPAERAEFRERGNRIYDERVLPRVGPSDRGRHVAIDVDGRGYEIADEKLDAVMRLRERVPDARCWIRRIGYETSGRIGFAVGRSGD